MRAQPDIHHHNVRAGVNNALQRSGFIMANTTHRQIGLAVNQGCQGKRKETVVINYEDTGNPRLA